MSKSFDFCRGVEKVQTANSGNFDMVKNQLLTDREILEKLQILGFSTGSLFIIYFAIRAGGYDNIIIY